MRQFLKIAAAGAGMALVSPGAWAAPVTLQMSTEYVEKSLQGEADQYFAEKAKEYSDGELDIIVNFGGALGYKNPDQFDAVSSGAIPIADTLVSFWGGIDPLFQLSTLPFVAPDIEAARALYGRAEDDYRKVLAENGQKLLFASPWPPSGIWSKDGVTSLDDLKNLKIRTYDTASSTVFREVGAAPVQLTWGDTVPQLATGAISAVLTSAEGGVFATFWDHTRNFTVINYAWPLNIAHMNQDVFDGLSPTQQAAIEKAAAEANERTWQALSARIEKNLGTLEEHDVTVIQDVPEPAMAALRAAAEQAVGQWKERMGASADKYLAAE